MTNKYTIKAIKEGDGALYRGYKDCSPYTHTHANLFSKIFVFECESIQIKMWRVEDEKEEEGRKKT